MTGGFIEFKLHCVQRNNFNVRRDKLWRLFSGMNAMPGMRNFVKYSHGADFNGHQGGQMILEAFFLPAKRA